jgi:hypothetical protein
MVIAYVVAALGFPRAAIIPAGIIAMLVAFVAFLSPNISIALIFFITIAYNPALKYLNTDIPAGIAIDALILVTFAGVMVRNLLTRENTWQYFRNPITFIYLIQISYLLIQVFNPHMHSYVGYIAAIRRILTLFLLYYICLHVLSDRKALRYFVITWFVLAFVCAFYGCWQEWFGFSHFEQRWFNMDRMRLKTVFVNGQWRRFSFMNDPMAFGVFMAFSFLFCIPLLQRKEFWIRLLVAIGMVFMLLGMAFSGTRTAYLMVPVGVALYILMTINKRQSVIVAILGVIVFVTLMFGPFYSGPVRRIRSAFLAKEDASLNVRDVNRRAIQPYIYEHPFGGGLFTSGVLGTLYNPNHVLAKFPADSGLLYTAIETGWVGLLLQCLVFCVVMQIGIRGYYRSRSPDIKNYYLGFVIGLFSVIVGSYAQLAFIFTHQIIFAFILAALWRMREFDEEAPKESVKS